MKYSLKSIVASAAILSCTLSSTSQGSGFALIESSASSMGQAFAGASAIAEDPSTIYFNPAGMTYLEDTQATLAAHIIDSNAKFQDKGSTNLLLAGTSNGGDGGNVGDQFIVPNFYYVRDFGEKYKFGLGINVPFGLATEYDDNWQGRYTSTNSEVHSINVNPSVAFKANDDLSIGLGMSVQYIEATLEKAIYQTALGSADATAKMEGDSWGVGFNIGIIYKLSDATRLGLHYRSEITQSLEGDVKYTNIHPVLASTAGRTDKDVTASIDLPSTFSISLAHELSDQLTLLADLTMTKWKNFDELRINSGDAFDPVDQVDEKWNNSNRYSLGLRYQVNDRWAFRTGVAHDETPIDDEHRTSRIPGDDRTWLSFGASYLVSNSLTIDVGYSHLWVDEAKIEEPYPLLTSQGQLKGEFDADVDILSVQATWKF